MKRHYFHPEADLEYTAAATYYAEIDIELARRFHYEIERLISDACSNPVRYRPVEGSVRRHFSQIFPYAVLYIDQPDRIWIVALMHLKRNPAYWKRRLR